MRAPWFVSACVLVALPLGFAAPQAAPSSEEQAALLSEMRHWALDYTRSLPDFLCIELTRRYSAPAVEGAEPAWKLQDTLTIRLSYFGQKEDYRVIRINDKPADKNILKLNGWSTRNDFGSMLDAVFQPKTQASFAWERWDAWKGRRVAVLAYRIERAHSGFTTTARGFLKTSRAQWGAKGLVFVDAEAQRIYRLTVDSDDMPADSPSKEVHVVLEYDYQKISDREFLLPSHSLTVATLRNGRMTKSDSEFTEYRKFSADTKIEFGHDGNQ